MKTEEICDRIVRTLAACPFIKGIVLGGSGPRIPMRRTRILISAFIMKKRNWTTGC